MDRLISENLILSLFDGKVEQEAPIFSKTMTKIIKGLPSAYKGMTNGEVLEAAFSNIDFCKNEFDGLMWVDMEDIATFKLDWWNSPYEPQKRSE